jgi:hypothetical protein
MMIPSASLALAIMLFQYPYPGQYPGRRTPGPAVIPGGGNTDAVATFNGTFKSADKKFITVEVEDGQSMRMYLTGSTKFLRDDKPAKVSDFHSDEKVIVDTSRDARMNLVAVKVEWVKPAPPRPDKAPERRPDQ